MQDWLNDEVAENQELNLAFGFDGSKARDRPANLLINGKGYVNAKIFYNGSTKYYAPPETFTVEEGKE